MSTVREHFDNQRRHKYRAKPTVVNGIRFDSKLEAAYYKHLVRRQALGEIDFFLRQIPFDLGGGTKYRCDFMVVYRVCDEHHAYRVEYIDVKGATKGKAWADFVRNKKQVEALYPVKIKVVRKGDF